MSNPFPRTTVAGVSLSRMIIGTNWILGYSHTTAAADESIKSRNCGTDAIADILEAFLESGVDTIMVEMRGRRTMRDALKRTEDRTGKRIVRIDTPVINVDDTPAARREAEAAIAESARNGATFCLPHHSSVEQLVLKNSRAIPRLPDYLCAGFLMQVEIEYVHSIIWSARKPVMTIKPMAAGRVSPFVGLTFAFATIRECDMVTVGCLTPQEAREDIEIGLAALDRRPPRLAGRGSVHTTPIMAKVVS